MTNRPVEPASYPTSGVGRFGQPNLAAGVVAGLLAGVVGAILWGGFTALTHFRIGYLALGIGVLVGYAIVRVGQVRTVAVGVTAAVITLVACAAGDTGSIYFQAAHDLHTSVGNLLSVSNPFTVLREDLQHNAFGLIFFAIAAWAAFRYVTTGRGLMRSRRPAQVPPSPGYGTQPSYGQPPASAQPVPPTYGQPLQPTYGQPTYGQPLPVPPTYAPPPSPTYAPPPAPAYAPPPAPAYAPPPADPAHPES
jgi:hypothetical protein